MTTFCDVIHRKQGFTHSSEFWVWFHKVKYIVACICMWDSVNNEVGESICHKNTINIIEVPIVYDVE